MSAAAHRPASRFVIRTPSLPFDVLERWGDAVADDAAARRELRRLILDPAIREAVFVASPQLEGTIAAWLDDADTPDGRAVERALVRYVSRMAGRATPFGLFAGVATGAIGDVTRLTVPPRVECHRRTRLDNDYLFAACTELARAPELRDALRYRPSSSLYLAAGRLRYAEARIADGSRSYHLVAVEPTEYLTAALERAREGATIAEIAALLCADPDITRDEAEAFVGELIDTQLLVPELSPAVTGREPAPRIVELLRQCPGGAGFADALADATGQLDRLDELTVGATHETYGAVAKVLGALPTKIELGRLFQVDLFKPGAGTTLGPAVVAELRNGIALMQQIAPPPDDSFAEFRKRFVARYETREVPLVEVLDEESGIGFGNVTAAGHTPLLAGLAIPLHGPPTPPSFTPRDAHLLALADGAARSGAREIELGDDDLVKLAPPSLPKLGVSLAVQAILAAESAQAVDDGRFLVRLIGIDSPGGRLLGRFCHGSTEIAELTREIASAEEAVRPDAVFAEIVHLPEGRIGNILLRPVLRAYEIPYLGTSGADLDRQLPITDLVLSVLGDRVVLRSRRLGREVIPCLTSAHNVSVRGLGVYRFLCLLSRQGTGGAAWSWGYASSLPFLPRVRRGKLVVSRACWHLGPGDLKPFVDAAKGATAPRTPAEVRTHAARMIVEVQRLREHRGLPRWVVLQDGDNELPIDLDNPLAADSFAHQIKGRTSATLVELFPDHGALCTHGPDGRYVHELVVPFVRGVDAPADAAPARVPAPTPTAFPRRFPPGSAWLYLKLYTGTATADVLLSELVGPLAREAIAARLADRWFFIRYDDPEHHLRVRFAGEPARLIGELLPRLHRALAPAGDAGRFWRMQLDTYEREVERYGGPAGIELAEQLFAADSDAVLAIVETVAGDAGAEARWRLAVRALDQLLDDLGFGLDDKLAIATAARDRMGPEFGLNTELQRQLGDKFRAHRSELESLLAARTDDPDHPYAPGLAALAARSEQLRPLGDQLRALDTQGQLTVALPELARAFMHMHVNRLLPESQRAQELVLYDLLRRCYEGAAARAKAGTARPPRTRTP